MVTPLGIGLAALGRPGYINLGHDRDLNGNYDISFMEQKAHRVLDAAWESGIRYFDAARSYGRAEQFLASWLKKRDLAHGEVTIGSKWGYTYAANWQINAEDHEIKEHSLPVLQRQFRESDELLGSFLSIYQIHSATLDSGVLAKSDVLSELARFKEDGLRIGLSLSGPAQADTLRTAMRVRADGELLFSAVQATWNLLAQEAGEALAEASSAGMGIIVKEALANGRLTDRNRDVTFETKGNLLGKIAREQETTIDALALAAVLDQPWVDVVLSGAATVEHLHSNVKAIELVSKVDWSVLLPEFREPTQDYWTKRSQLAWN